MNIFGTLNVRFGPGNGPIIKYMTRKEPLMHLACLLKTTVIIVCTQCVNSISFRSARHTVVQLSYLNLQLGIHYSYKF